MDKSKQPNAATGSTTAGARMIEIVEMPMLADADDVRIQMLNDFEKCLGRHDVTLTDLMRVHQKQRDVADKMASNLAKLKRQEDEERQKGKDLGQLLKDLVKGISDLNKGDKSGQQPDKGKEDKRATPSSQESPDNLRKSLDEVKQKANKLLGIKDEPAKKTQDGKSQKSAEDQTKAAEDQVTKELTDIMQSMNQNLNQLNVRLNTKYKVHENPETTDDVREVLDRVLADILNMFKTKRGFEDDDKRDLDRHVAHAENMLAFLDREVTRLLAIGNRKEAASVDRKDYGQVMKFVQETFNMQIRKLTDQNKGAEAIKGDCLTQERLNEQKQKTHDQEMLTKRTALADIKRQSELMFFQTELLRCEQRRNQSRDPEMTKQESLKHGVGSPEQSLREQSGKEKPDQSPSKTPKDPVKEAEGLADTVKELNKMLEGKNKELQGLKKAEERDKRDKLEQQMDKVTKELERVEKELQDTRLSRDKQQPVQLQQQTVQEQLPVQPKFSEQQSPEKPMQQAEQLQQPMQQQIQPKSEQHSPKELVTQPQSLVHEQPAPRVEEKPPKEATQRMEQPKSVEQQQQPAQEQPPRQKLQEKGEQRPQKEQTELVELPQNQQQPLTEKRQQQPEDGQPLADQQQVQPVTVDQQQPKGQKQPRQSDWQPWVDSQQQQEPQDWPPTSVPSDTLQELIQQLKKLAAQLQKDGADREELLAELRSLKSQDRKEQEEHRKQCNELDDQLQDLMGKMDDIGSRLDQQPSEPKENARGSSVDKGRQKQPSTDPVISSTQHMDVNHFQNMVMDMERRLQKVDDDREMCLRRLPKDFLEQLDESSGSQGQPQMRQSRTCAKEEPENKNECPKPSRLPRLRSSSKPEVASGKRWQPQKLSKPRVSSAKPPRSRDSPKSEEEDVLDDQIRGLLKSTYLAQSRRENLVKNLSKRLKQQPRREDEDKDATPDRMERKKPCRNGKERQKMAENGREKYGSRHDKNGGRHDKNGGRHDKNGGHHDKNGGSSKQKFELQSERKFPSGTAKIYLSGTAHIDTPKREKDEN